MVDLYCKKCDFELNYVNVYLVKGKVSCASCHQTFNISDFLTVPDEKVRRIGKPSRSKIILSKSYKLFKIVIPPAGWSSTAKFFLFFSIIWNFIVGIFLLTDFPILFLSPFLTASIIIIGVLVFILYGYTSISFDKNYFIIRWTLFGFSFRKKRDTKQLAKIIENVVYTANDRPVKGIGLIFLNQKYVTFGSNLEKDEKRWIIGELYHIKSTFHQKIKL